MAFLAIYQIIITILIGILSALLAYVLYRRTSVMLWGYIAGTLPDSPYGLTLIGVTNIQNLLIITHSFGIILFAILLVILDIFLIELSLLRYLSPLKGLLKPLKPLFAAEEVARRLEKYNTIPRPERLKSVYVVSVVAGIIHLCINLIIGIL